MSRLVMSLMQPLPPVEGGLPSDAYGEVFERRGVISRYLYGIRMSLGIPDLRRGAIPTLEAYGTVHDDQYLRLVQGCSASPSASLRLASDAAALMPLLPRYLEFMGVLQSCVDAFKAGSADRAFCLGLGGHHAGKGFGHGYCLLNPLAAAVRYAQAAGFERVLIVDWDIHHGDGTQDIFASDDSVFHVSIHSMVDPYMAKASRLEWATDPYARKLGHRNVPLLARMFDDRFVDEEGLSGPYWRAPDGIKEFARALADRPWQPDLIAVFAGTDSHRDDCGEGVTDWTEADFIRLLNEVLRLAEPDRAPVLMVSGGSYHVESAGRTYEALIRRLAR